MPWWLSAKWAKLNRCLFLAKRSKCDDRKNTNTGLLCRGGYQPTMAKFEPVSLLPKRAKCDDRMNTNTGGCAVVAISKKGQIVSVSYLAKRARCNDRLNAKTGFNARLIGHSRPNTRAPWCSGYHICLTRRRPRVRSSPEPWVL